MELQPGDRIDRFTLEELLGEGGQGSVWRASDPLNPDAPCALKLIPMAMARGSALERARREAHALSRLDHPSLVACDGLFEDLKRGVLGLVMSFVKGVSLSQAQADGRFGAAHAGLALQHIADALAYLHGRGVVHRDVKLENVLIADSFFERPETADHVVLVDLGIAIATDPDTRLTQEGGLVGTLSYLAPEALDPANFEGGTASPRVDVFAFGILASRLLSGTHPTGPAQSSTPYIFAEAYRKAKDGERLSAPGIEGPWGKLIQEALAVDAEQRIADGAELSLRIRDAGPPPRPRPTERPPEEDPSAAAGSPPRAKGTEAEAGQQRGVATSAAAFAAPKQKASEAPKAEAPGRGKVVLGALALVGAAGGALYFANSEWNKTPPVAPKPTVVAPRTPTPSAPTPSATQPVPEAATATLPQGCESVCACCPSGRDCGPGGCSGELADSSRVVVRVASVADAQGNSLAEREHDTQLCLSLDQDAAPPTCFPIKRKPGEAEGGGLEASISDLVAGRVRVEVKQRLVYDAAADVWSDMASGSLKLTGPLQGAALCRGVELKSLPGHVPVGRIHFYLDDVDAPAPERCQ